MVETVSEPKGGATKGFAALTTDQRQQAMARFFVLRPHIEDGVPLPTAARDAGVSLRTAERWLARYRAGGLAALARPDRADRGRRRLQAGLVTYVEEMVLRRPPPSIATVHRKVSELAVLKGWPVPSYATVYDIARSLEPALLAMAQEGDKAYRQAYDLLYRREADWSNAIWQADHTELDLLVVDPPGPPAPG